VTADPGWALYDEAVAAAAPPDLLLRAADGRCWPFPVARWAAPPDRADRDLLARCVGPTLDVGCGPGRLVGALAARGVPALGVDPSPAAVRSSLSRGGTALRRSVFDRLPGEGRWHRVLLADGNIGIGGDPVMLLRRCAELLAPAGTLLAECDPPGAGLWCGESWLRYDSGDSAPFRWARVGADQLTRLVATLPLRPTGGFHRAGRWFVELERR
jgi:SAM-dependent methyltransferase